MTGEEAMMAGLVTRAREGDRSAWEEIVNRYTRLIWAVCAGFELGETERADVAQAVWLRLLSRIDEPGKFADLGAWVATAANLECHRVVQAALSRQLDEIREALERSTPLMSLRASAAKPFVRSLTRLAAFFAGREGPTLLDESAAHLAGGSGHDPASWAKVREAAGFVVAGVRYRCSDWADAAWRPAEVVLRSRFLSSLFVAIPTIVVAVVVLTHKGTMTLFTSFGSIFAVGTFLSGVIKAGRKYRGVEPPEPKARQAKK